MLRPVLNRFLKIVNNMEKYLWIQAISTEESSRIYKDGKLFESGSKIYGDIFAKFNALRRETKVVYQDERLTLCKNKDAYFIAGNFNELDSAKRKMAYNFYIQVEKNKDIIDVLKASLEGYTISAADEELLREVLRKHKFVLKRPKKRTMLLILFFLVFFFLCFFLV